MTDTPTTPQRTPALAGDAQVETVDRVARYHSAVRSGASFRRAAEACMALADDESAGLRQRLDAAKKVIDRVELLRDRIERDYWHRRPGGAAILTLTDLDSALMRPGSPCPTLCDPDCEAECHEDHQITSRKDHTRAECPALAAGATGTDG